MAVNSTMPMYEYQCRKCKHRFERIQKFSDPILKACPECRGTVDQVLTAAAVRFKGSGWYATDYAKGSGKTSAEGASEVPAPKADEESEAKPKPDSVPKKSHEKKK